MLLAKGRHLEAIATHDGAQPTLTIAHALGQDVILIAQHETDIPFDLRHIRYVKYLNNEEGLKVLAESVGKRLQSLVSK